MAFGAVIHTCTCQHVGQDRLHGKGMRVFNIRKNGDGICTVCGKVVGGLGQALGSKKGEAKT